MTSSLPKKNIAQKPTAAQCMLASALFQAIERRDADKAVQLARWVERLDDHAESRNCDSPLLSAARHSHGLPMKVFEALLPRSNPRKRNIEGQTALMFAAAGNHAHTQDLIRLLLPLSDPMALTRGGASALDCSMGLPGFWPARVNLDNIALLLPTADLEQRNALGQTPLERARATGSQDLLNLILSEMSRREALSISEAAIPSQAHARASSRL